MPLNTLAGVKRIHSCTNPADQIRILDTLLTGAQSQKVNGLRTWIVPNSNNLVYNLDGAWGLVSDRNTAEGRESNIVKFVNQCKKSIAFGVVLEVVFNSLLTDRFGVISFYTVASDILNRMLDRIRGYYTRPNPDEFYTFIHNRMIEDNRFARFYLISVIEAMRSFVDDKKIIEVVDCSLRLFDDIFCTVSDPESVRRRVNDFVMSLWCPDQYNGSFIDLIQPYSSQNLNCLVITAAFYNKWAAEKLRDVEADEQTGEVLLDRAALHQILDDCLNEYRGSLLEAAAAFNSAVFTRIESDKKIC